MMVINHFVSSVEKKDMLIEQVLCVVEYDVYEHLLDLNKFVEFVGDVDDQHHSLLVEDLKKRIIY
jgi:hypothetical protein